MAIKQIEQVKNGKPFRPADLIIYGGIIVVVLAFFIAFVFTRSSPPLEKIYADLDGKRVLTYDFASGALTVESGFSERVASEETADKLTITIDSDGGYNTLVIEKTGRAYISDSDCSFRRDCVRTAAITDGGGMIVCVPHKLKVYASDDLNPSLG